MLFGSGAAKQGGNQQQFPNAGGNRFQRPNAFNNNAGFSQQQGGAQRQPRMMQQQNQGQNQQQFGGQNQRGGFNQQGNMNQGRPQRTTSPVGFGQGNAGGNQSFNNNQFGKPFGNRNNPQNQQGGFGNQGNNQQQGGFGNRGNNMQNQQGGFGNQGNAQSQGGFGNRANNMQNQQGGGFGNKGGMQNQGGFGNRANNMQNQQGGFGNQRNAQSQGGFGNRANNMQNQQGGGFGNRGNQGQQQFGGGQNQGFNQQGGGGPNQGRPRAAPVGFGSTAPIGFGNSNAQSNQGAAPSGQFGNRFNKTFPNAGGDNTGFRQKPTNFQQRGNQGQFGQGDQGGMKPADGFGGQWKQNQQQQEGGFQGGKPFQRQGGGPGGFNQGNKFGVRRTPHGLSLPNQSTNQDGQMSNERPYQGNRSFQGQKPFGDRSHSDEGQGRMNKSDDQGQRGQSYRPPQGDSDQRMDNREDGFGFRGRGRGRGFRGRGDRGGARGGDRGGARGAPRGARGERGGRFMRGRGRGGGRNLDRYDEKDDREEGSEDRGREEEEEEEEDDHDDYSDEHDEEGDDYSGEEDGYSDEYDEESPRGRGGRYDRDSREESESPKKGGGPDLRNLISGGNKPSITDRIKLKGASDKDSAPPPPPRKEPPKITLNSSQAKPSDTEKESLGSKMTNGDRKRLIAKYELDERNVSIDELEKLFKQEQAEAQNNTKEESEQAAGPKRPGVNKTFLRNLVGRPREQKEETKTAPPPPPQKSSAPPPAQETIKTQSLQMSRQMSNQTKADFQSLKDKLKKSQKASMAKKQEISFEEPDVYIPADVLERFRVILDISLQKEDETVEGECMTMAPLDGNRGSEIFERERGTDNPRTDWFVKKYERAAADRNFNDPKQLRPLRVLRKTMDYLVNEIVDVEKKKNAKFSLPRGRDQYRFDDIHNFLWGTFRSIKQDISIQRCAGERYAIELHEEIARYYIIAINEGRDPELRQFDSKLNIDQLTDTLTSLRLGYKEARTMAYKAYYLLKDQAGFNIQVMSRFEDKFYLSPNEAEFLAYDMIIQLENERNYLDILQRIMSFPSEVLASKEVKFAIKVITAVKENNYTEYFRLLGEADYLTSCVMSTLIKAVREKALKTMYRSQSRNNIETVSIDKFYELLAFEDYQEAEQFLKLYGLEEASQGMDMDDIQGSEGPSFRLTKVQIEGEDARTEARKKFLALKTAMNIRIIEIKRNIENFKGYQGDRDIHFDNTQVPRKFLVKGAWKQQSSRHYLTVLKYMLGLSIDVQKEQKSAAAQPQPALELDEIDEVEPEEEGEIEDKPAFTKPADKAGLKIDKAPSLTVDRKDSMDAKAKAQEAAKQAEIEKKKEEEKKKAEEQKKLQEQQKERERIEQEEIRRRKEKEIKRKEQRQAAANKLSSVLGYVFLETKKQTLAYLESVVEYERELKAFRQGILQKPVKQGLAPQKLQCSGLKADLAVMEEEEVSMEQHAFFSFVADALAEQEPGLERHCYKTVLFHPLFKDVHFELFKKMIEFLTDDQERLEQIEFDQLPTLYENKNIEFEWDGELKKLWVCFKVYDENYRAEESKEKMKEDNKLEAEEAESLIVPSADILSSNLIIFILTGNKKLDKDRFEPIYNAISNKKHIDSTNILFMQVYETRFDKPEKRLKKKEIIDLFDLNNLYDKGLQPHFIKISYHQNMEVEDAEGPRFFFKDIDYALKDKVTAVVKKGIEDQVYTKLPCFYTLRDVTEKVKNSLEELGALTIDYESSEIEIKAKLLHELMSTRSIEAYYYVKHFINHAVNSIKENFDYWHENIDRVAPEFLEDFNQKAVDKIKTAKGDFDAILDKMLKINDFDEKYWKILESGNNKSLNVNAIYSLIERKVERVFRSRKREIQLDEVIALLEHDFKFGVIGVKGSWKLLFKTVYEYYIQFLDDLQPICILLDEDFKLNINIDALYKDIEDDLMKYNEWIKELEFQIYDAEEHAFEVIENTEKQLLRKRPMEAFGVSESSILHKDIDEMDEKDGSSENELDQTNISTRKMLNTSSNGKNINVVPYLVLDWEFDKQFQTLKRIHIDDEMFKI